jgi:hypothetical protein
MFKKIFLTSLAAAFIMGAGSMVSSTPAEAAGWKGKSWCGKMWHGKTCGRPYATRGHYGKRHGMLSDKLAAKKAWKAQKFSWLHKDRGYK